MVMLTLTVINERSAALEENAADAAAHKIRAHLFILTTRDARCAKAGSEPLGRPRRKATMGMEGIIGVV